MATLRTLLTDLAILFPDAYLGKAPNSALFPCFTYNVIDSNTLRANSYTSRTEQYNIPIIIFDNTEDCEDLVDLQEEIESTLLKGTSATNFFEVKKTSSIGPRYITNEKYYQIINLYRITLGESTLPPPPEPFYSWRFEGSDVDLDLTFPLTERNDETWNISVLEGYISVVYKEGVNEWSNYAQLQDTDILLYGDGNKVLQYRLRN